MTPEELADELEESIDGPWSEAVCAHLRRLASTETALHNLHGYVVGLEEEVKRLRGVLTELVAAHYAPPWGGDDPTYEKALAAGRRMDAAWDRAREALEPVEGGE
jgi:hypothetical protein